MLTSSSPVSPVMISKIHSPTSAHGTAPSQVTQKYDSATFSDRADSADSFFMGLVSRIAQEVRTATTTADIRQLRQAVQSGDYAPNPGAIAGKMLFFTEA